MPINETLDSNGMLYIIARQILTYYGNVGGNTSEFLSFASERPKLVNSNDSLAINRAHSQFKNMKLCKWYVIIIASPGRKKFLCKAFKFILC